LETINYGMFEQLPRPHLLLDRSERSLLCIFKQIAIVAFRLQSTLTVGCHSQHPHQVIESFALDDATDAEPSGRRAMRGGGDGEGLSKKGVPLSCEDCREG
jgi:hypothetical protein